jgi:hypothetical protein
LAAGIAAVFAMAAGTALTTAGFAAGAVLAKGLTTAKSQNRSEKLGLHGWLSASAGIAGRGFAIFLFGIALLMGYLELRARPWQGLPLTGFHVARLGTNSCSQKRLPQHDGLDTDHGQALNTSNLLTIIGVTILVGVEVLGAALAAGWAIGGLFQLGREITWGIIAAVNRGGIWATWKFVKGALKVEPIYH